MHTLVSLCALKNLSIELPYNFPLELIDEIISWNENDFSFLYSVSLVSKTWRAAALRYLFKLASFLCKHDFVRWRQIGASLPHVAQYVRTVMVDLGTLRTLRHRAKSLPTGFIARTYDLSNDSALLTSALDFTFPKDSEFDVIIPIMRNAKKLIWTTPSAEDGFDPTAANVTRFLQSFPNITHLYYLSLNLFRPEVQAHFMSFFHNLRKCSFTSWKSTQSEHVYVFSGHPRIDVSKLEKIWCEECEPGSLDWLVDDVLHYSPSRIRKIGWEYGDPPFSPNNFARLLLMAHETLEELCFRPPWSTDG